MEAEIPLKSNEKQSWIFDRDVYHWRHLIENFFDKLKQNQGISRYDKRGLASPRRHPLGSYGNFAKLMTRPNLGSLD